MSYEFTKISDDVMIFLNNSHELKDGMAFLQGHESRLLISHK